MVALFLPYHRFSFTTSWVGWTLRTQDTLRKAPKTVSGSCVHSVDNNNVYFSSDHPSKISDRKSFSVHIWPLNLDKLPAEIAPVDPGEITIVNLGYNPGNLRIPRKNAVFEPTLDEHSGLRLTDFKIFHCTHLRAMLYYPIF